MPRRAGFLLLRTWIFQPFFLTISDVTQRPRPVPVSPLVVTKGSNIVGRTSGALLVVLSRGNSG